MKLQPFPKTKWLGRAPHCSARTCVGQHCGVVTVHLRHLLDHAPRDAQVAAACLCVPLQVQLLQLGDVQQRSLAVLVLALQGKKPLVSRWFLQSLGHMDNAFVWNACSLAVLVLAHAHGGRREKSLW